MKKDYEMPQVELLQLRTVNVITESVDQELAGDGSDWPWFSTTTSNNG